MSSGHLPLAFSDLDEWVDDWGLLSEKDRYLKLHSVSIAELRGFYQAMLPRMPAILDHLDQFSADALPEAEQRLFDLAMTFAETAHPIDLGWPDVDFTDAYPWQAFQFLTVSSESSR